MTIEELEKYCIEQNRKYSKLSNKYKNADMRYTEFFYAGQACAFLWISAVIQQNKPRETPH